MKEYSEKIEQLAELRMAYEDALKDMKNIKGKYKNEADKLIKSMKNQNRKGV